MAGAIDKKINDLIEELGKAPKTHVDARSSILADIALSREFANTYLDALCRAFTGGKNSAGDSADMSLGTICETLAAQRLICYGAGSIKGNANGIKKFTLPPVSGAGTLNGVLGLTEPSTSLFGIKATDIGETYPITLSNTEGATQTQDSNTFSTWVGDYYLVRSRVSGELIDIADDVNPYSKPDTETVFGNAIAWVTGTGGDVATEQEANTWNYNWATANIASVTLNNSGAYNELTTLTLSSALTQGSNTSYTPLGPAFAQKFYLKRKADQVNSFTITGTTTINSVSITAVSEADMAKVKYGDVISGTGIPDDNVSILAVQTEKNTIRLSETGVATATGPITITVNSVPFGYAKDDIFCQVEVVAEGLVTNDNWLPTGNTTLKDGNQYADANEGEDDLLVANTTQFIGMLGFFDPAKASDPTANNDLTKGASASYSSSGKEYGGITYPDIENNPFFPSNQGTTKTYEYKDGGGKREIVGTQPPTLGNKDIWSGRFVRFDFERTNNVGDPVSEFRYVIDNAEKFYYAPSATDISYSCGTATTVSSIPMPRAGAADGEPRAELPRDGLGGVVTIVQANETLAVVGSGSGSANNTSNFTVPVDDVIHADPGGGLIANKPSSSTYSYYYRVNNGIIEKRSYQTTYANASNGTHYTATSGAGPTVDFTIVSNYVARKLTTDGTTTNTDVGFIEGVVDELQGTTTGSARFRDPITTANAANPGFTDAAFATYLNNNTFDSSLSDVKTALADFYTTAGMSARNTRLENGTDNVGAAVNCAVATTTDFDSSVNVHAKWVTFSTSCNQLKANLETRIAEIDKRIGRPTYGFSTGTSAAAQYHPPTIYVSGIPPSPAAGEFVPYGRSIYNACNYLLGQDMDILGGIIKDIESLRDLIDLVKNARNKYDIFSGRDKVYS